MTPHDQLPPDEAPDAMDRLLDETTARLRAETPSAETADEIRRRAWARVASAAGTPCDALRAEIPAFRAGTLSEFRSALVGAHARECPSCRKAIAGSVPLTPASVSAPRPTRSPALRLAAAAAGLAGLAAVATVAWKQLSPPTATARIVELEGQALSPSGTAALAVGSIIGEGEVLRTARGSWATLELADGSRVEVNERAELSVTQDGDATTLRLGRGDVIVTAAKRSDRNLFVDTADCSVAVKGTVFTVGHGLKGSHVGVLEGEVHVNDRRETHRLLAGDQVTTNAGLDAGDLEEQVAWSRRAERYSALVEQIDAVARELQAAPLARNVRHASPLLAAMPEDTVVFVGLPNTPGNLDRLATILHERIAATPEFASWWTEQAARAAAAGEPTFDDVIEQCRRLSSSIGDEVAIGLVLRGAADGGDAAPVPVLVAEARDEATLRDVIDGQVARHRAARAAFRGVLDRRSLAAQAGSPSDVLVVVDGGHVLAGTNAEVLGGLADAVAGRRTSAFASTSFHDAVAAQYRSGAEIVVGIDLERLVSMKLDATAPPGDAPAFADRLRAVGLGNLDHLLLVHAEDDSAVLRFKEARTGLASWLAEPAPMGSLAFVSPDATAVLTAVVKDPSAMLSDVALLAGEGEMAKAFATLRDEAGIDFASDVAAPLGGEITLALDGPVLPEPAWKVVLEVYDPATLQAAVERIVERAAADAATTGASPTLRTVQLADGAAHVVATGLGHEIWYAFRDGYLVACPQRALLEVSLQARSLGSTFATSPRLAELLPTGGGENLSLLAYQDVGSALGPVMARLEALGAAPGGMSLPEGSTACLLHAVASENAITFGLRSAGTEPGSRLAGFLRSAAVRLLLAEAIASHDDDAGN